MPNRKPRPRACPAVNETPTQLAREIKSGNWEKFDALCRSIEVMIRAGAGGYRIPQTDHDDFVSKVFGRILTRFHTYDPTQRFRPWVQGIILNTAREWRRENKRRNKGRIIDPMSGPPLVERVPDRGRSPLSNLANAEVSARLRDILTGEQMRLFKLRRDGMSLQAIAEEFDVAASTISRWLKELWRELRKHFSEKTIAGFLQSDNDDTNGGDGLSLGPLMDRRP